MFRLWSWLPLLLLSARLPCPAAAAEGRHTVPLRRQAREAAPLVREPRQSLDDQQTREAAPLVRDTRQSLDDQLQLLLSGGGPTTTAEPNPEPSPEPSPEPTPEPSPGTTEQRLHSGGAGAGMEGHHSGHSHPHSHHSHPHMSGHHGKMSPDHGHKSHGKHQTYPGEEHSYEAGPGGHRYDKMHHSDMSHDRHSGGQHSHDGRHHHGYPGHHMSSSGGHHNAHAYHYSGTRKHHSSGGEKHHLPMGYPGSMKAKPAGYPSYHSTSMSGGHAESYGDANRYGPPGQVGSYMGHMGQGQGMEDDQLMEAYMAGYELGMITRMEAGQGYKPHGMNMDHHDDAMSGDHGSYSHGKGSYSSTGHKHMGMGMSQYSPLAAFMGLDPMTVAFLSGYDAGLDYTDSMAASGASRGAGYPYQKPGSQHWDGMGQYGEPHKGHREHTSRHGRTHRYGDGAQHYTRDTSRVSRAETYAAGGPHRSLEHHDRQPNSTKSSSISINISTGAAHRPSSPGDVQPAPYVIESTSEGYETRYYPASRWVCAVGPREGGSCAGVERDCLRRLRRYLGGENREGRELSRAGPLLLLIQTDSDSSTGRNDGSHRPATAVCSSLGTARHSSPPTPLRGEVFLLHQPDTRLYVRTLGRRGPELGAGPLWREAGQRLRRILGRDGAGFDGSQVLAFLHPPPDGRREVAVIKREVMGARGAD